MRQMALDWTLSRRQRVDFGAPPQTWEQYSNEGLTWDSYVVVNGRLINSFYSTASTTVVHL